MKTPNNKIPIRNSDRFTFNLVQRLSRSVGKSDWNCSRYRLDSNPDSVTSRRVTVVDVQLMILSGLCSRPQSTQPNTREIECES